MAPRENWSSWLDFLFSCLGYMVGLGNVWRFPYICFKNGGGTFVIVYFLCVLLISLPITFLEMSISQYSNLAAIKVWQCCPLFQGIGYGMFFKILIVGIYYTVIISWTLYYFGMSFSSFLPWASCENQWNTMHCLHRFDINRSSSYYPDNKSKIIDFSTERKWNTSVPNMDMNGFIRNNSMFSTHDGIITKTPTEEFWEYNALKISNGIEVIGTLQWPLTVCLLLAWVVTFLALIKGIKSSAKVMYFAATVPYILLLILFIKGLTLPGSLDGLRYFITPNWNKFLDYSVWTDAAAQAFYSVGIGGGILLTISSYNKFHNNCYRDAIILPILDGLTSLFAGFVVFTTLGYMSHVAKVNIQNVVKQGPGITFMVFPEALATLPFPQVWSAIFSFTLFLIGIDSQIAHVQFLASNLTDCYPNRRGQERLITLVVCIISFMCGIIMTSQGGMHILQLLDQYLSSLAGIFVGMAEVFVVSWIYGTSRLSSDIEMMTGRKPHRAWHILWKYVCPVFLVFMWILSLTNIRPVKYGNKSYPAWAIAIGWIIAFIPIIPLPIGALAVLRKTEGNFVTRLKTCTKPSKNWKPAIKSSDECETVAMNAINDIV